MAIKSKSKDVVLAPAAPAASGFSFPALPVYSGAAPKGAALADKLVNDKKYTPRAGTKFSTLNQWARLQAAIDAGQTVGEILAEAASVNISECQVDKGYLAYVLARGWVRVA